MELVDSVDELRSSSSIRGISMPNFLKYLMRGIASALKQKSSKIPQFKRRNQSGGTKRAQKEGPFSFEAGRFACLIYDHFRVTGNR